MIMWTLLMFGLSLVSTVSTYGKSTVNNCLWHNNTCVEDCPEWMVIKRSDCTVSYWKAQRTCEHPEQMLVGTVCGFSRCDCPDPLVLDTETGFCYDIDNCPTKHTI